MAQGIVDNHCVVPSGFFEAAGLSFTNEIHDYKYPWIDLRYYPIISVSKIEHNTQGYGITPAWVEISSRDYILNAQTGQIMLVNKVPAIVEQSVRATYTAGYAATPDSIKHVCLQICSNMLHGILQRKVSPVLRVDDWTLKVLVPEAFTHELRTILSPYVRKTVACG